VLQLVVLVPSLGAAAWYWASLPKSGASA